MSENTERLIVDVDASGVNAGAKSLADLVDAAQDAGRAADGLGDKFDQVKPSADSAAAAVDNFNNEAKQTQEAAGDAAVGLYRQNQELQNLLDRIRPTRVQLRDLAQQQEALAKAQANGLLGAKEAEEYNAILANRAGIIDRNDAAMRGLNVTSEKQKTLQQGLTITTGQYRAAMGMLPAQMTDIVTQLAGGQNPFLIMIQQGGQIKDSFGGLGNTFQALKQFISPSFLGLAGATAAIAAMGYAAYTSAEQADRLAASVTLMGGAGFKSAEELNRAAVMIQRSTGDSISSITDRLIELNNKGTMTADMMEKVAISTSKLSDAGLDAGDVMKDFDNLVKNPIKSIAALNEQYGFMTEAQMKHLIQTQKEKGEQAAAAEALDIYTTAMNKRADDVIEKTDNVGQAWKTLKTAASDVFNDMGIVLRSWGNRAVDIFKMVKLSIDDLLNYLAQMDSKFTLGVADLLDKVPGVDGRGVLRAMGIDVETVEKNGRESIEKGKQIAKEFAEVSKRAFESQADAEARARNANGATGSGATDEKSREAVSKLANESTKHNKEKAVTVAQGDRILEQYQAQELALRAQIKTLKDRNAFDVNASEQMKNYQLLVAKISILEGIRADAKGRALTKDEQSLLASKEEILAKAKTVGLLGDQVKQLERQAQITDELTRSGNDLSVQVAAINASWGMSADEAARLLENMQRAAALRDKGATQEQIDEDARQREALRQATDAKTQDWAGGARSAIEAWGKDATNTSANVQKAITGAMDAGLDSINSFVMTGKASFADFTKSILGMMVQMINKWLMFKAIQGIGGAMGFDMSSIGFNAKGGVYDSPSLSAYSNRVYTTPQLFTYDKPKPFAKGGVFAEAGPEAIMPLAKDSSGRLGVRAQGGAGGGVSIGSMEVNVDQNGQATANVSESGKLGRAYGDAMAAAIQDGIARASSPGGQIWMLINGHA